MFKFKIKLEYINGLETYGVYLNGSKLNTYMSRSGAQDYLNRLKNSLGMWDQLLRVKG